MSTCYEAESPEIDTAENKQLIFSTYEFHFALKSTLG